MENNKSKYRKSAVLSSALALAILASSCAKPSEDVTVTMKEKKEEEDVKPKIEVKEEATWAEFDEETFMYKIDLDRFLKDKLKLSNKILENSDVTNLIETIHERLGEDFYTKDKYDNELYNLNGESVTISASYGRWLFVKFYEEEYSIEYQIDVNKNGKTENMSRSREEDFNKFAKYYIIYSGNKEFTRSICLRENSEKYLSIGLHEGGTLTKANSISFDSNMAEATIKLSDEEYDELHEIMLSYSDSDNLYAFLSDNAELINKYLDLIREKNEEYYEYLCNLINAFTEKAKVLRYE